MWTWGVASLSAASAGNPSPGTSMDECTVMNEAMLPMAASTFLLAAIGTSRPSRPVILATRRCSSRIWITRYRVPVSGQTATSPSPIS